MTFDDWRRSRLRRATSSEDQIDVALAAHPRLAVARAPHAISVSSTPANTSTNLINWLKAGGQALVELGAIAAARVSCENHGAPVP